METVGGIVRAVTFLHGPLQWGEQCVKISGLALPSEFGGDLLLGANHFREYELVLDPAGPFMSSVILGSLPVEFISANG